MKRASLYPDFEKLKPVLERVFLSLKAQCHENWYPSLILERRVENHFSKDATSENFQQEISQGINLRVFNGQTLYEVASDDLSEDHLLNLVSELKSQLYDATHYYDHKLVQVPNWTDRLKADLDEEILTQIPKNPRADQWIHFGAPMDKEVQDEGSHLMGLTQKFYQQIQEGRKSLTENHLAKEPDYSLSRLGLEENHFLFIDSETKMSQSFYRNSMVGVLMKNSQRALLLQGGLGGEEVFEVSSAKIRQLYDDLQKPLRAEKIKPGRYKLLMGPSITGVFAHEAFGHSQEGDTWARGRSQAQKLYERGQKVGNQQATILNNPAIYQNAGEGFAAWGSYYFDEEGWLAQKQYLVKEGELQKPMTNLTSAYRLRVPRSANGKRESWRNAIYTRQTNTYFSQGDYSVEELMQKIDYGFLAVHSAGGMEDPKGMGIQVGIAYLEEVKNGQLTGKIFKGPNGGDVQMTGYVPDYLNSILGKSKIMEEESGKEPWIEMGGCGKYHKEIVQAGCGGTYILVDNALLG